eukprot:scaffold24049_cov129-Isochrysis_galbana.AAC.1
MPFPPQTSRDTSAARTATYHYAERARACGGGEGGQAHIGTMQRYRCPVLGARLVGLECAVCTKYSFPARRPIVPRSPPAAGSVLRWCVSAVLPCT